MKKYLLLCLVLGAFFAPIGSAFADDDDNNNWNNGNWNNGGNPADPVDDGAAGHVGDDAQ